MASSGNSTVRVEAGMLRGAPRDRVHLLPVDIESDGNARVDQYFTPAVQERDGELLVSYRGRALRGRDLPVPAGYVGLVLREDREPCSDEEERTVRVKSAFSSLTYWNLETRPTADDSVVMAMTWPRSPQAIHAPSGRRMRRQNHTGPLCCREKTSSQPFSALVMVVHLPNKVFLNFSV
ncbi:ribonuclease H2 subunit C [Pristis pectinata]|uniref:ribonuclease H2 subunit C n=1 Tax=Pristis pectinata TaxID=685728 RepID=UPI00223DCDEA|nr:ribonuclease H2 subunit C [Pristis pectinata]